MGRKNRGEMTVEDVILDLDRHRTNMIEFTDKLRDGRLPRRHRGIARPEEADELAHGANAVWLKQIGGLVVEGAVLPETIDPTEAVASLEAADEYFTVHSATKYLKDPRRDGIPEAISAFTALTGEANG